MLSVIESLVGHTHTHTHMNTTVDPSVLSAIKKEEYFKLEFYDNVKRERLAAHRSKIEGRGRGDPVYPLERTPKSENKTSASR